MSIDAIGQALLSVGPVGSQATDIQPEAGSVAHFASLMQGANAVASADALLQVQGALSSVQVGADLTAKVAGSLTQTVNKLISLQ